MIGKTISHYRITEKIGEGGMGVVYLAEDTELKRRVALKFLPERVADDADALARFKREAQTAAALNHPNIITIHEIGQFEGQPFIAMSYIEGGTLRDEMDRGVSKDRALDIAIQSCDGLETAHRAGIIHRDIKPENFMSDPDGRVKILDFGIATFSRPGDAGTDATTAGTVYYMSPEQARGEKMDARSDVFSLGTILYELLAGRRPFKGEHTSAVHYSILNEDPEPLTQVDSSIDERLWQIVAKTLEKNPNDRYQSTAELAADLKAVRSGTAAPAAKSSGIKRFVFPGAVAVIALVLFFFVNPFKDKSAVDGGDADANTLAIMYFENMAQKGDPDRLGEIVTDLLITNLSQSEDLKVVSSQRLYDILKLQGKEGTKVIDRSTATEIAKKAKAKWMMLGSILQVSPSLIVTTQLVDVASGTIEGSQRLTGAPGETVFALVDRMTGQTRDELNVPVPLNVEPPKPVAHVTTNSLDAYRYYVEGLDHVYKIYYADAAESFRQAIELDSTFAMAYYQYAVASANTNNLAGAVAAMQQAFRHIDRVSDKERLYIESVHTAFALRQEESIAKLTELTERYPDEKAAYFMLATHHYMQGDDEQAIEAYNKVLVLDPLYKPAFNQLAYSYDRVGNFEKSIWAINQYIEMSPDEANPYDSRGDLYAYNGDIDNAIDSYKKAVEIKPDFVPSIEKLGNMYLYKGQFENAEAQYKALTTSVEPAIRSAGREHLATLELYRGRLHEALALLDAGITADEMEGFRGDSYLSKFGHRAGINVQLGRCDRAGAEANALAQLFKKTFPMLSTVFDLIGAAFAAECGYVELADSIVASFEPDVDTFDRNTLGAFHGTKGFVALRAGDLLKAVHNLEIADSLEPHQFSTRYYLAEAYLDAGRAEDAITLLEATLNRFDPSRLENPLRAVTAVYLLGTAYEQIGDTGKATAHYRRFLDMWKDADAELDEVPDARKRLDQLGAGG
jgi:serine/threonine protein kinase/tetratricopeptide (TPR) repeat protein